MLFYSFLSFPLSLKTDSKVWLRWCFCFKLILVIQNLSDLSLFTYEIKIKFIYCKFQAYTECGI